MKDTRKRNGTVKQVHAVPSKRIISLLIEVRKCEGAYWYYTSMDSAKGIKAGDKVSFKRTGISLPVLDEVSRVYEISIALSA